MKNNKGIKIKQKARKKVGKKVKRSKIKHKTRLK